MSSELSPVNVRASPAIARGRRISETNDTKTDCIIAQLSAFTAALGGGDGSPLILAVSRARRAIVDRRIN